MDPDPRLPQDVRMVLASFETPANLPLARELWTEDATRTLTEVQIDTRTAAEAIATPGNGYNADGTRLDPEALNTILTWLHPVLIPSPGSANP